PADRHTGPGPLTTLSARNPQVQRLRRLARRHRERAAERAFVIEGPHAVAEALAAHVDLEAIFVEPGVDTHLLDAAESAGVAIRELEPGTLAKVSDAVTPQPVMAI